MYIYIYIHIYTYIHIYGSVCTLFSRPPAQAGRHGPGLPGRGPLGILSFLF